MYAAYKLVDIRRKNQLDSVLLWLIKQWYTVVHKVFATKKNPWHLSL